MSIPIFRVFLKNQMTKVGLEWILGLFMDITASYQELGDSSVWKGSYFVFTVSLSCV